MSARVGFVFLSVMLFTASARAKDFSGLYDQTTLEYWQGRYSRSTGRLLKLFQERILRPEELRRLSEAQLLFPLLPAGPDPSPFECYSTADPPTVTMPILSINFISDLSIAYAWLTLNDYSVETITNYIAMLRYRSAQALPQGRYQPPLQALHIPDRALSDAKVNDLSLRLFNDARAFVLGHELGHVYYRHPGNQAVSAAESQHNEEAADAFAIELMRRAGDTPVGIVLFFTAAAQWDPRQPNTHPLSPRRLLALASVLRNSAPDFSRNGIGDQARVEFIAAELADLAGKLADPDIQTSNLLTGRATDIRSLVPRHKGELIARQGKLKFGGPFQGFYQGDTIRFVAGEHESLPIQAVFERNGDAVSGRYSFGLGECEFEGRIISGKLYYNWRWGDNKSGKGVLQTSDDGDTFSGTWGYREASEGGGTWSGRRR